MFKSLFVAAASAVLILAASAAADAQSFTCPAGKNAACLEPGTNICSGTAKCVALNAACFDARSCDARGFVCKSLLDESDDTNEKLKGEHAQLTIEKNTLMAKIAVMEQELAGLNKKIEQAVQKHDQLEHCVSKAENLDEAQICRRL